MNKNYFQNQNLGEFIMQLQRVIKVNDRLMRDEDIVTMARMSKSTYQKIKKGTI